MYNMRKVNKNTAYLSQINELIKLNNKKSLFYTAEHDVYKHSRHL